MSLTQEQDLNNPAAMRLDEVLSYGKQAGFDALVTSVRAGHHDDGPAGHAGWHAVDVGAVNGTTVGFNRATWDFVRAMIASGRLNKVGTIPEIADNPQMQAYARERGVVLFADPGTGPHVHLQIPAEGPA